MGASMYFGCSNELADKLTESGIILTHKVIEPSYMFFDSDMHNPFRIGDYTVGDKPIDNEWFDFDENTEWYEVHLNDDNTRRVDEKRRGDRHRVSGKNEQRKKPRDYGFYGEFH